MFSLKPGDYVVVTMESITEQDMAEVRSVTRTGIWVMAVTALELLLEFTSQSVYLNTPKASTADCCLLQRSSTEEDSAQLSKRLVYSSKPIG